MIKTTQCTICRPRCSVWQSRQKQSLGNIRKLRLEGAINYQYQSIIHDISQCCENNGCVDWRICNKNRSTSGMCALTSDFIVYIDRTIKEVHSKMKTWLIVSKKNMAICTFCLSTQTLVCIKYHVCLPTSSPFHPSVLTSQLQNSPVPNVWHQRDISSSLSARRVSSTPPAYLLSTDSSRSLPDGAGWPWPLKRRGDQYWVIDYSTRGKEEVGEGWRLGDIVAALNLGVCIFVQESLFRELRMGY